MKKVRNPLQKRSQEKKQKIIDASFDLFCQKGIDQTNTKEISKSAGVSVGTFYSYFEDKVDVLLEIIRQQKQMQVEKPLKQILQSNPGKGHFEVVYIILKTMLDSKTLPEPLQRQVSGLRYTNKRFEVFHEQEEQVSITLILELIEAFGDETNVPDKKKSAQILLLLLKESFRAYAVFKQTLEKEDFLNELAVVIHNYLFGDRPETDFQNGKTA